MLDIVIIKTGRLRYEQEDLTSELFSVYITFLLDFYTRTNRYPSSKLHCIINWPKFEEDLLESVQINPHTESKEQIDMVIQMLTSAITNAIDLNSIEFT